MASADGLRQDGCVTRHERYLLILLIYFGAVALVMWMAQGVTLPGDMLGPQPG